MTQQLPSPGTTVSTLVRAVRRRWRLVAVAVVVGFALGLLFSVTAGRAYTASATVTINPITSALFATGPLAQQVNTATEAEVMSSGEVRTRAAATLADGTTAADLDHMTTVSIPGNSLALTVTADGRTPQQAADIANAMVDSYLAYRKDLADQQVKTYLERVDARLAELEKKAGPGNANAGVAEEIAQLRRDQSEALTTVVNPGSVIQRATPSTNPSTLRMLSAGIAGGALGLLVGLGLLLALHRREGLVLDIEDVDPLYDREVAAKEIIKLPRGTAQSDDWSGARDQILAVRVAIDRVADRPGPIVVLGCPEVQPFATQLLSLARVDSDAIRDREVENLVGAMRGRSSLAAAGAGVLVVAALSGHTRLRDLKQQTVDVVGIAPSGIPLVSVLADDQVE